MSTNFTALLRRDQGNEGSKEDTATVCTLSRDPESAEWSASQTPTLIVPTSRADNAAIWGDASAAVNCAAGADQHDVAGYEGEGSGAEKLRS
jgi:hypothetical protein